MGRTDRLAGMGIALFATACCPSSVGVVVTPSTLSLGDVTIGETVEDTLTLRNVGDRVLKVWSVGVRQDAVGGWEIDADDADLLPGGTSRVRVRFTPVVAGWSRARVEIVTDDHVSPLLRVPLDGTGVEAGNGADTGTGAGSDDSGSTRGDSGDTTARGCGDADGDGHDACDAGGDCDDGDASAWPLVVQAGAAPGGDGTVTRPLATIAEAAARIDGVCRTIVLLPGTHAAALPWSDGALTICGAGTAEQVVVTPPAGDRAFDVSGGGSLELASLTVSGGHVEGDGGAVSVEEGALAVRDAVFQSNSAKESGGAVYAHDATISIDGATFTDNEAGWRGGGLSLGEGVRGSVRHSRFVGDRAGKGGGLALSGGVDVMVANDTFSGNRADEGGGVWIGGDGKDGPWVWANVVVGSVGSGIEAEDAGSVAWNLVYGSTRRDLDLGGHADDGDNLVADPLLDAALAPTAGSPAIDSGPEDGSGPTPYTTWSDPDGTRNDRGWTGGP